MSEEERKIRVLCYAGSRGDETPRAFFLSAGEIRVLKILERWVEEDAQDRAEKRCFRVRGDDGETYLLYYHEEEMAWFCGG